MKCEVCQQGVEKGPLYRVNETGVKGIWRHESCGANPDPDEKLLCDIIHKGEDHPNE